MDLEPIFDLSNEWSSNPNDLLDTFFDGDFFNELPETENIDFNDYGTAQAVGQNDNISPVPSSELEFHGFIDENINDEKFNICEYINYEHAEPIKSSSPSSSASDSGLSSDNMEMDTSPDYEPLSPTLSSPGPSISECGSGNSPIRSVVTMPQEVKAPPKPISVSFSTPKSQPSQVIVGKVQPIRKVPSVQTVELQPIKQKANVVPKKEVKIIKMSPATKQFTTVGGHNKKVTIRFPTDAQQKIVKTQPTGTLIINKSNNPTVVPEVRKLIRVQNTSSPRSILLPVSFQDVKDFRTIKIVNASNLNTKSPNIKLAAANLLQQSKQGLFQKNVLVPKEKLMEDPMSDYTSDAESNVYEDVMLQNTTNLCSINGNGDTGNHSDSSDSALESNGSYPKLMLTTEEKRLLAKEGIVLPGNYPLTKHEERELKRIRRKIRNKISAQDSRKRKKEYVDGLEERVKQCTDENQTLMKRIKLLQNQNQNLMTQMKKLQAMLTKGTNKTAQPATCLMVLLLSLALVAVPNLKLGQNSKETELANALQEGLLQNRRNLLFNSKEQLGEALVDEEMSLDDIIAFNELNEQDIVDEIDGNTPSLAKKPKTLIDFDVDDTNWRDPNRSNKEFNKNANGYQEYLKSLIGSVGFNIGGKSQKEIWKNDNDLNKNLLNLISDQANNLLGIDLDKAATFTKGLADFDIGTKKLLLESVTEQQKKLNASELTEAGDRKILLKGV